VKAAGKVSIKRCNKDKIGKMILRREQQVCSIFPEKDDGTHSTSAFVHGNSSNVFLSIASNRLASGFFSIKKNKFLCCAMIGDKEQFFNVRSHRETCFFRRKLLPSIQYLSIRGKYRNGEDTFEEQNDNALVSSVEPSCSKTKLNPSHLHAHKFAEVSHVHSNAFVALEESNISLSPLISFTCPSSSCRRHTKMPKKDVASFMGKKQAPPSSSPALPLPLALKRKDLSKINNGQHCPPINLHRPYNSGISNGKKQKTAHISSSHCKQETKNAHLSFATDKELKQHQGALFQSSPQLIMEDSEKLGKLEDYQLLDEIEPIVLNDYHSKNISDAASCYSSICTKTLPMLINTSSCDSSSSICSSSSLDDHDSDDDDMEWIERRFIPLEDIPEEFNYIGSVPVYTC